MDRECIEHAKAQLIEAEKRKKEKELPVLTVGNFKEYEDLWKRRNTKSL